MNLKKFVSAALAATMTVGMSVVAHADENAVIIGAPISLTTMEEATEFKAGDAIAVPIDITSSTGELTAFGAVVTYNTEYLQGHIVYGNDTTIDSNLQNLTKNGTAAFIKTNTTIRGINNMCDSIFGDVLETGTANANDGTYILGWYTSDYAYAYSATDHEAYYLFTVIKNVSADDLNLDLVEAVDCNDVMTVQDSINGLSSTEVPSTVPYGKANACAGALNVVIDTANLSNVPGYIQGVTVETDTSGAKPLEVYKAEGDVYTFPVRIQTSNPTDSAEVTIKVTTTPDEEGTGEATTYTVATKTISLNGTVKSYE